MWDEVQAKFDNCANEEEMLELVFSLKDEGMSQQEMESALTTYVLKLREEGNEANEDEVSDILDRVVGWCSPQARIFP